MEIHDEFEKLLRHFDNQRIAFFSKSAETLYTDMPSSTDLLVFGRETSGLPDSFRDRFPDRFYNIPMHHSGVRSLNLANSVSIVVYHQMARRQGLI